MKTIEIKGQSEPIHFGIRQVNDIAERLDVGFEDLLTTSKLQLNRVAVIIVVGLLAGAEKSGVSKSYSLNDAWDEIENRPQIIIEVMNHYNESILPWVERLGKAIPTTEQRPQVAEKKPRK